MIIVLILLISKSYRSSTKDIVYSATDDALDLAIAVGIINADSDVEQNDNLNQNSSEIIKAVVVPHHLVASKSIALGIKSLTSSTPRIVIVISPDHYARCLKMLCTSKGSYKSFFGITQISEKEVDKLEKSTNFVADSNLFKEEHGVYTIVPFIKHYIPNAEIVPIAISQKGRGSEKDRAEIIKLLKPLLSRKDVALVISSDFSHYLPLKESNEMDEKTQKSFCSGNSQEILTLKNPSQSDCPLCLWVLHQEALELGFWNPAILAHTNSAELMNDRSVKETTSHFAFKFSETKAPGRCDFNIEK